MGEFVSTLREPFWRTHLPAIVVGLADVFLIGLGMGVPILAILLGFGAGWWVARRAAPPLVPGADVLRVRVRGLLGPAGALAALSFVVVLAVWGPWIPSAFDPAFDAKAWGIPLILYTSQASMIGWLALMIVISPVLQFMAVVTGGALGLAWRAPRTDGSR